LLVVELRLGFGMLLEAATLGAGIGRLAGCRRYLVHRRRAPNLEVGNACVHTHETVRGVELARYHPAAPAPHLPVLSRQLVQRALCITEVGRGDLEDAAAKLLPHTEAGYASPALY
jgi:hypothetical protein